MGLDGGTIISRNDVLRGQCWDLNKADNSRSSRGGAVRGIHKRRKLDPRTAKVTRWSTCALSGQPLAPPIVACFLGRLYNKSAVLEWLLARAGRFEEEGDVHRYLNQLRQGGDSFDHITSTKDVFALQYSPASLDAAPLATAADGAADPVLPAPLTCPITSLRCDCHPFVALRRCGHVMAERALKEAGGDGTCPVCGTAFAAGEEDAVPLLPDEAQLERLRELLPSRRKASGGKKDGKADKKRKQQDEQQQEQQRGAPAAAAEPATEAQHEPAQAAG